MDTAVLRESTVWANFQLPHLPQEGLGTHSQCWDIAHWQRRDCHREGVRNRKDSQEVSQSLQLLKAPTTRVVTFSPSFLLHISLTIPLTRERTLSAQVMVLPSISSEAPLYHSTLPCPLNSLPSLENTVYPRQEDSSFICSRQSILLLPFLNLYQDRVVSPEKEDLASPRRRGVYFGRDCLKRRRKFTSSQRTLCRMKKITLPLCHRYLDRTKHLTKTTLVLDNLRKNKQSFWPMRITNERASRAMPKMLPHGTRSQKVIKRVVREVRARSQTVETESVEVLLLPFPLPITALALHIDSLNRNNDTSPFPTRPTRPINVTPLATRFDLLVPVFPPTTTLLPLKADQHLTAATLLLTLPLHLLPVTALQSSSERSSSISIEVELKEGKGNGMMRGWKELCLQRRHHQ